MTSRKVIYFCVLVVVAIPLITKWTLTPAPMKAATSLFARMEAMSPEAGKIAIAALDFSANTKAENEPQALAFAEHLFRKRIPVAFFSLLVEGTPFLDSVPRNVASKLERENPGQKWVYGKDWVNLGYRPGALIFLKSTAAAEDLPAFWGKDVYGAALKSLPIFAGMNTLKDVSVVGQFTGSAIIDRYIQFFRTDNYAPKLVHGCTSITVPEAFIYLDSQQLYGLYEGISGAAWYSELLRQNHPEREPDAALLRNTALGAAQLFVLFLIVLGNLSFLFKNVKKQGAV